MSSRYIPVERSTPKGSRRFARGVTERRGGKYTRDYCRCATAPCRRTAARCHPPLPSSRAECVQLDGRLGSTDIREIRRNLPAGAMEVAACGSRTARGKSAALGWGDDAQDVAPASQGGGRAGGRQGKMWLRRMNVNSNTIGSEYWVFSLVVVIRGGTRSGGVGLRAGRRPARPPLVRSPGSPSYPAGLLATRLTDMLQVQVSSPGHRIIFWFQRIYPLGPSSALVLIAVSPSARVIVSRSEEPSKLGRRDQCQAPSWWKQWQHGMPQDRAGQPKSILHSIGTRHRTAPALPPHGTQPQKWKHSGGKHQRTWLRGPMGSRGCRVQSDNA